MASDSFVQKVRILDRVRIESCEVMDMSILHRRRGWLGKDKLKVGLN